MPQEGPAVDPVLRIGPHHYRVEEDLFLWQPRSVVLPEHAHSVVSAVLEIHKRYGYVLYLLDGSQAKPLGPEARRVVIDALRPLHGSLAIAAFGVNWIIRGSGTLLFSAARLVTGLHFPFRFSPTEAEARAFLNEFRDERARARRADALLRKR